MTLAALKLGLERRRAARTRQGSSGRRRYLPLTEWILKRDKLTEEILKGKATPINTIHRHRRCGRPPEGKNRHEHL